MSEQAFIDVDGKPTLHKDGYASLRQKVHDERGNRHRAVANFGVDGKPALLQGRLRHLREIRRAPVTRSRRAYFGVDGKPTLHKDGNPKFSARYDERGNETEVAYFGADSQPTLHKDGYARFSARDTTSGAMSSERAYFGVDGRPTLHKNGYASSPPSRRARQPDRRGLFRR